MRWLINYIRSCFCNHEWENISGEVSVYSRRKDGSLTTFPTSIKRCYVCKKCKTKKLIKY